MQAHSHDVRTHRGLRINVVLKVDPTRTTQLRAQFSRAATKRFNELKTVIRKSIVDNDCFGLIEPVRPLLTGLAKPTPALPGQFAFPRSKDKITGFMDWLNEQEEKGILEIIRKPGALRGMEEAWTDTYVRSAYQKGIARARQEMKKQGRDIPLFEPTGRPGIEAVLNQPFHADRLGALYTRVFSELTGIDQAMDQQISRVLTQGILDGINPRRLARTLADRVEKIGITRARTMARTEVIRAHHVANIGEYRNWGVEGVTVKAEWATAGYRVCPICSELEGKEFTLDEIEGMIPRHPNCRCVAIPVLPKEPARRPRRESEPPIPASQPSPVAPSGIARGSWGNRRKYSDVVDQLKEKYNFSSVDVQGASFDIEKKTQIANKVGEEMARMVKMRPGLNAILEKHAERGWKTKLAIMDSAAFEREVIGHTSFKSGENIMGYYQDGTKFINIKHTDLDESIIRGYGRKRWSFSGGSWINTFRHEYGHYLHARGTVVKRSVWRDEFLPTFPQRLANGQLENIPVNPRFVMEVRQTVSEYATTNIDELYAESFEMFTAKNYLSEGIKGYQVHLPEKIETLFSATLEGPVKYD